MSKYTFLVKEYSREESIIPSNDFLLTVKSCDYEEAIKKTNGKYECIVNRRDAIKRAIQMANKQDIIVLAGKGHEQYQEINNKRYPFDESAIVNEIIEEM